MLTHEIKFLTSDDSFLKNSEDYLTFKYETKKKSELNLFDSGKRNFHERRGGHWRSPCPRHLKHLESKLRDRSIVFSEFTNDSLITAVFSSGAIAYLTVKINSLDVTQVLFDSYCVGKLTSPVVTAGVLLQLNPNVAISKAHILFIHIDRNVTLLSFGKTNIPLPCRISEREPHIQAIELGGSSRRTDRHVSYYEHNNKTNVLIWSATTTEPAPWSPMLEDLANLHLYNIHGSKATLSVYHQLENETLMAELSQKPDIIHIVEQRICHKNGVSIEWLRYEVGSFERATKLSSCPSCVSCVSVCAPVRVVRRTHTRLLLACIDGTLYIAHKDAGLTHTTKTGFIVTDVRWSGDLVMVSEESGKLQCFDQSLASIHHHTKCLDLTSCSNFSEPRKFQILSTRATKNAVVILVIFNMGPIALLRISYPRLLTAWLRLGRTTNCVSLLRAFDWDEKGPECLSAMTEIVNRAMAGGQANEIAAITAIGAYMAPLAPHSHSAKKFTQPVYRLARKFFHHLLRRGRIEKALSLAVDLEAWDLFVDARWMAHRLNMQHLADEATALAGYYAQFEQQDSECPSSCSQCSSCSSSDAGAPPPLASPAPPAPPRAPPAPPPCTSSIRPNLHQYLDRDNTIWDTDVKNTNTTERLKTNLKWTDNILNTHLNTITEVPNSSYSKVEAVQKGLHANYRNVFHSDIKKEVPNTIYRYSEASFYPSLSERTYEAERKPPEKNKVKFSDTVTVAVVAKEPPIVPEVERELADSLPLSPPHRYLAAFDPLPPPPPGGPPRGPLPAGPGPPPPGTTLDYVEV